MSATTNPTPEEILAAFQELGMNPIPLWEIGSTHIRVITARGVYLAGHISSPQDQDEFDAIEQELANRVFGRRPAIK
jgi:hypothetical protein